LLPRFLALFLAVLQCWLLVAGVMMVRLMSLNGSSVQLLGMDFYDFYFSSFSSLFLHIFSLLYCWNEP